MPDRAVVAPQCPSCGIQMVWAGWAVGDWRCSGCGHILSNLQASPSRSVVAISEDRQWMVVLDQKFGRFRVSRDIDGNYVHHPMFLGSNVFLKDTGQSAEDVLREFLREREK